MQDSSFTPQPTKDGSYTFFSEEFQETFHSSFGAKQEAEVRYIEPCAIKKIALQRSSIRLLDICYGLGYNSAAALEAIWSVNPECRVELVALEISPEVPRQAIKHDLLALWRSPISLRLTELSNKFLVQDDLFQARLILGDARKTIIPLIGENWRADAIFLDPFSPPKCPQLWTIEFIALVAQCLAKKGNLATYSCSAAVRTALLAANLNISSIIGAGRNSPGTLANFEYKNTLLLSPGEQEHLKTRAAIPYRDPSLEDILETIVRRRQQEQQSSDFEPTSQWRKRWFR